MTANGKHYLKDGKDHIKLDNYNIDVDIRDGHLQFDRLFGKNEELNVQTNKIINQNMADIIKEVKPVIIDILSQFVIGIGDRIFSKYSYDELFLK